MRWCGEEGRRGVGGRSVGASELGSRSRCRFTGRKLGPDVVGAFGELASFGADLVLPASHGNIRGIASNAVKKWACKAGYE